MKPSSSRTEPSAPASTTGGVGVASSTTGGGSNDHHPLLTPRPHSQPHSLLQLRSILTRHSAKLRLEHCSSLQPIPPAGSTYSLSPLESPSRACVVVSRAPVASCVSGIECCHPQHAEIFLQHLFPGGVRCRVSQSAVHSAGRLRWLLPEVACAVG